MSHAINREAECLQSRAETNSSCRSCGVCFAELLDERNKLRDSLAGASVKIATCTKLMHEALAKVDAALNGDV